MPAQDEDAQHQRGGGTDRGDLETDPHAGQRLRHGDAEALTAGGGEHLLHLRPHVHGIERGQAVEDGEQEEQRPGDDETSSDGQLSGAWSCAGVTHAPIEPRGSQPPDAPVTH